VTSTEVVLVGADGCKAGWIAVRRNLGSIPRNPGSTPRNPGSAPQVEVFTSFAALLKASPDNAIVVVDMPIGLPEFSGKGGRGPEALVRPLLGTRQSSVFSIPSRAALYADTSDFTTVEAWYAAHRKASEVARATSDPPRGVSIHAFGIFSKIREIDTLLIARPDLRGRVFESHPEVAFCRLNGDQAMQLPKKIKGSVNPAGMAERKALLCRHGYDMGFLDQPPPRGAATDDFLDAAVMMLIAGRIASGSAKPFPNPPLADGFGIPVAIWA
jgi:predicted RNase H-like nuclease